jgi:uncharacterized protein YjbI with pentapeptide repeats
VVGGREITLDHVEPAQLQILCRFLYERRRGDEPVTKDQLKRWGGMREAIERYYDGVVAQFPRVRLGRNARGWKVSFDNLLILNRPRAAVQRLCEEGLVDQGGYRTALNESVVQNTYGLPARDIEALAQSRLLNEEPRADTTTYELTHDSLAERLQAARTRRRRGRRLMTAGIVVATILVYTGARNLKGVWSDRARVQNLTLNPEERRSALQQLVARTGGDLRRLNLAAIDGARLHLPDARLRETQMRSAVLDSATLDRADMVRAQLAFASLKSTSLIEARLDSADLYSANAANANLSHASLSGATLRGTTLAGARLSGATLREAKVIGADLRDATVDSADVEGTDFTATAWWLARGWTDEQVIALAASFPVDRFAASAQFKGVMAGFDSSIVPARAARDSILRRYRSAVEQRAPTDVATPALARLLNQRARLIAQSGTNLVQGLSNIDEALGIADTVPELLDTRAYILIRRTWSNSSPSDRRRGDAMKNLVQAVRKDAGTDSAGSAERYYHLGLAYESLDDSLPAMNAFRRAAAAGYAPTYERVLTPSKFAPIAYGSVMLPRRLLIASLDSLIDTVAVLARAFADSAARAGVRFQFYETYRSRERQAYYYSLGRTIKPPNQPVTNAPEYSSHWCRVAIDVLPIIGGHPSWDAPSSTWKRLGDIGKHFGFMWGGDWPSVDLPHFEFPPAAAAPCSAAGGRVMPPAPQRHKE